MSRALVGAGRSRATSGLAGAAALATLAGLTTAAATTSAAAPENEPVDGAVVEQQVWDELAEEGTAGFWVYLRERADLSAAASFTDRGEQGWFVYEQLTETAEQSQAGLQAMLDRDGVEHESFWIANTVKVVGADTELVEQIAARPDVERITADRTYRIPEPAPGAEEPRVQAVEWNIDRIGAPQVWEELGTNGENIVVGSIDTGVQFDHPALVAQYRGNSDGPVDHNHNWWDPSNVCGSPSLVPCDNHGHGTHTMGTMVGDDGGTNQIGVAPGARWITAKGCETNNCSQAALLSSGQFMLAPTDLNGEHENPELRPHVVNNSWGADADTDPWYVQTVESWVAAGIFPQFSNGNAGPACETAGNPGNLAEAYAAGAFDINDELYVNSSRGPSAWGDDIIKPNIAAPGVNVRSSVPGDGYAPNTGTSMASPHVAGAVALMWSAAPSLVRDIEATRAILDGAAIDTADLTCGGTPENNNVWGQGRLDAFAAVELSPRGPVGALTGTVIDAESEAPIAGATLTITGPVERRRTTGEDGTYSSILPVGDYDVTASAFGYEGQAAPVTITEDQTTKRDFALQAVDTVAVTGQITDGSGHGWPLYSRVHAAGTPASTFTNPLTGQFRVDLPVNDTYTLQFESQYPGYAPATQTIDVAESDQELYIELVADSCQAPGYLFSGEIGVLGDSNDQLTDFLADQGVPSSVFNWGDDPSAYDAILINAPPFGPGQQPFLDFLADTDAAGTGVVFLDTLPDTLFTGIRLLVDYVGNPTTRGAGRDTSKFPHLSYRVLAEHPILDGSAVGDEVIFSTTGPRDHAWFFNYEGEGRQVIANREVPGSASAPAPGIGVQERTNNRHVLMSMHGVSTRMSPDDWTDDGGQLLVNALEWVAATSLECEVLDGGLVLGNVNDLNTGSGVANATVASVDSPDERGASAATPDDPALGDGFYWLFSSLTGRHELTASASNYADHSQTVDVAADAANEADFALAAGQLTAEPTRLDTTLRLGQSGEQTFTITNTGTAPTEVELSRRRGSFDLLGVDGDTRPVHPLAMVGQGAEVNRLTVPGGVSYQALPGADRGTAPAAQAAPAQEAWEELPALPRGIMDNNLALVDGKVYSFGGSDGTTAVAEVYVFDVAAGTWEQLDDAPALLQQSARGVIGRRVYLAGGFADVGPATWIYHPATGGWSSGADMPAGRAAPGSAVLDGQLYVVGGCTTNQCTPFATDVFRYDPDSDSWERLAPYPEPVAFLACGGAEGLVVCAGGVNGSGGLTSTYAFDPATGQWERRADMPVDLWGSAYHGANGLLLVSGGAALDGAVVTNEGYAYDPDTNTWQELSAGNHSLYRSGSACGFYRIGGATGGFNETDLAGVLPGFDDCADEADVPWLAVDPLTAALEPGESVTVTVSTDSGAAAEEQPGAYSSGVGIRDNTPYTVEPVGVTMNVTPPNNWGKITGTVTGNECDGETVALRGAIVQVNGKRDQVTLRTDTDGGYGYWMATNNNPLELVVGADRYVPQTGNAQLRPRRDVAADFTLQALC